MSKKVNITNSWYIIALKIMAGQWSLTVVKAFVTTENPCQTVTMTTTA